MDDQRWLRIDEREGGKHLYVLVSYLHMRGTKGEERKKSSEWRSSERYNSCGNKTNGGSGRNSFERFFFLSFYLLILVV